MVVRSLACAAILSLSLPTASQASVIATLAEVGSDLVLSWSGSIDLTGLTPFGSGTNLATAAQISGSPFAPTFSVFSTDSYDRYVLSSAATNFMSNVAVGSAVIAPGRPTNFVVNNEFRISSSYVSGSPIAGTATFAGRTLASISAVPGDHVWTLPNAQTVTLTIPTAVVPLPLPAALLVFGLGALGLASGRARRKRRP